MIMVEAGKKALYGVLVIIYGVVLLGLLLYSRFPQEKFHEYSVRFLESRMPGTACSIAQVSYGFPARIIFKDVQIKRVEDGMVLFSDPHLVLRPVWQTPARMAILESSPFGGKLRAQLEFAGKSKSMVFRDVQLSDINLEELAFVQQALERNITGTFGGMGYVALGSAGLDSLTVEGSFSITAGELELKEPLLQMDGLEFEKSLFDIELRDKILVLQQGNITNSELTLVFKGKLALIEPLPVSRLNFVGTITPRDELFAEKPQLRGIVERMQKRYGGAGLPFSLNGSLERPVFYFE